MSDQFYINKAGEVCIRRDGQDILCADQEQAFDLLDPVLRPIRERLAKEKQASESYIASYGLDIEEVKDSLHPFPSEQYEVEVVKHWLTSETFDEEAVITPRKEKVKKPNFVEIVSERFNGGSGDTVTLYEVAKFMEEYFKIRQSEPVLNEGKGEDELWTKVISEARFYDGSPKDLVAMREHFKKFYRLISR